MFTISFKAIDNFDEIKQMSAKQFDLTKQDIEGIIELDFNGSKYGMFFDDCPFGNERLIRWFVDLLTIVQKIRIHQYVAYRIPDSANLWLEFKQQGVELQVSLVEDIDREVILDLFITEPNEEFRYSNWNGVNVSSASFTEEIMKNAHQFLDFVTELNPDILQSTSIQILQEKLNDVKRLTS
ncbi:hypothetical protein [Paenibacillus sp. 1781tsa1]|uniref:hypothetical protein n=1 Tax=Paenibacillus sp. 1781tsa1 TaxID=2953810 RepID=UPI00209CFE92|nr:hypothetical protein [Paenibacillus sp. 1781tsa1]MCP1187462.1 hypothetical protein [Paenibacillus sp. 1781tsa1]